MAEHYDFGKEAEAFAVDYLLQNGYLILERNWFFQKAEIDIIAQKNHKIIVVEVKARRSSLIKMPEETVNTRKKRLIIKATNEYIQQKNIVQEVQFDVISLIKSSDKWQINHIKNAFESFE